MIFSLIALIAIDASTEKSARRDSSDAFNELHDALPEGGLTSGLLNLDEVVWRMVSTVRYGKPLAKLVEVGLFASPVEAVSALSAYAKEGLRSIPELDILAQAHPRGHPKVVNLLDDYIARNRDNCMFRELPVSLQRRYDDIFTADPSFKIEHDMVDGAPRYRFTRVADISDRYVVNMLDDNYGELNVLGGDSWLFDLSRRCGVMKLTNLHVIPKIKVAVEVSDMSHEPTRNNLIAVHWPHKNISVLLTSADGDVPIAELKLWPSPSMDQFYIAMDNSLLLFKMAHPGRFEYLSSSSRISIWDGDYVGMAIGTARVDVHLHNQPSRGCILPEIDPSRKLLLPDGSLIDSTWTYTSNSLHEDLYWECLNHAVLLTSVPDDNVGGLAGKIKRVCLAISIDDRLEGLQDLHKLVSHEFRDATTELLTGKFFSRAYLSYLFKLAVTGMMIAPLSISEYRMRTDQYQ